MHRYTHKLDNNNWINLQSIITELQEIQRAHIYAYIYTFIQCTQHKQILSMMY